MSTEAPLTAWDPAGPETPRPDLKVAGVALAEPEAFAAQPVEEMQFAPAPAPTEQVEAGRVFKIGSMVAMVAVVGVSIFTVITDDGGKDEVKPSSTVAPPNSTTVVPGSRPGKTVSPAEKKQQLVDKATQKARQAPAQRLRPKKSALGADDPEATSEGAGPPVAPGTAQAIAKKMMPGYGWKPAEQFGCLYELWNRESGWRTTAGRVDGPYGIGQANPGTKMASAGPEWRTDAATQIKWGFGYIKGRYQTPCKAWAQFQAVHWY